MDDAETILARAARYRALADRVTDEQIRAALLELAEKNEALSQQIRAAKPERPSPPGPSSEPEDP